MLPTKTTVTVMATAAVLVVEAGVPVDPGRLRTESDSLQKAVIGSPFAV